MLLYLLLSYTNINKYDYKFKYLFNKLINHYVESGEYDKANKFLGLITIKFFQKTFSVIIVGKYRTKNYIKSYNSALE